jgi:FkbM family methyltransferase
MRLVPAPVRNAVLRQDAKYRAESPILWQRLQNLSQWFAPGGIVDIGANIGAWSRQASRIFSCPIHMIEAQPSLEPQLRQTGFPYTLTLLGPEYRPSVQFHLSGTGSSVMEEVTGFSTDSIPLSMQRLDDLELALDPPLLLKLDVQGFELEVLTGATETLKRTEVVLTEVSLMEYNKGQPLMHEVVAWLAERDFLPFDICGGLRRSSDAALFQTDMIFVRRDSSLRTKRKFWAHEPY